ncbi:MAG: PqqD family protein [Chloroflexi bacterium]|nr:PqqD family protein [Chloroflexota bacterium]MBK6709747.1 PqqD family protein [Chloroflexota bacterium]MBK7179882.1 PqqD family protein [Chloroflexota bacterium]MBK7918645.1 PqqD family protein [Chloroflexota bacterium]MBK8932743.1 PqqD family protein [Chloroflexota bacterium]
MTASNQNRLVVDRSVSWQILDGDAVIVSPKTGKIRVLNQVGTFIWQMLVLDHNAAEIQDALVSNYAITPERAARDLQAFISDLSQRNLIFWESSS